MLAQRVVGCLILLATLRSVEAGGATFILEPSADALLASSVPGNNFGGAGALSVAGPLASNGRQMSLLRFDVAATVASLNASLGVNGWRIDSLGLQLTIARPNNALFAPSTAGTIDVLWLGSDGWIEGTGSPNAPSTTGITYATASGLPGAGDELQASPAVTTATSGTANWPLAITGGLRADIAAGGPITFLIRADAGAVSAVFNSVQNPNGHPRLLIDASPVPEPSLLWLASVVMLRRSRMGGSPRGGPSVSLPGRC
jgi:hypothetical protein